MSTGRDIAVLRRSGHHGERCDHGTLRGGRRAARGLCRGDRALARNEQPPLGAHLVTPRIGYLHHGIHVGAGAVVHYGALGSRWRRGRVEEVSLTRFAHGHPVRIRPAGPRGLEREEIVRRAISRLGENRYRLFTNNCEHFTEWCVHGEPRSRQIEHLLERVHLVPKAMRNLRRWLRTAPLRRCPATPLSESCLRVLPAHSPAAAVRGPWPATSVAGPLFFEGRFPVGILLARPLTDRRGSG
jgi:hypothetical protein